MDASLQFELLSSDNDGPGFTTTLKVLANYLSTRASMADLLAAAVYASVRSCGGPIIPLRTGRIDATAAGPVGVPQPENSRRTFINQFDRMGFSIPDMIQMVACGHTIGRVHSTTFPHLVPSSTPDGEQAFDSTDAVFDNKIVTDYVSGNTTDPLVVGPSIAVGQNADLKVFNADRNATITAMTDARAFATSCQAILQRMIEVVPSSVSLSSSTLVSYMVKPVGMQLTLNKDASTLALSGWIRVKTTKLPMDQISSLTLDWLDRNGGKDCGKIGHCSVTATVQGAATGLDDSFAVGGVALLCRETLHTFSLSSIVDQANIFSSSSSPSTKTSTPRLVFRPLL